MVSDAAYGLILTVGAMLLYKLTKPAKGKGKMILLIMFGGISTFIWGMIFGGWFGETWHPLIPSLVPMENPMGVLILALGLGVVHIMYGMAINGVRLIKQKKYIESIVETWDWFFIYIGLFLFAGNMLLKLNSEGMKIAGLTLAGALYPKYDSIAALPFAPDMVPILFISPLATDPITPAAKEPPLPTEF